MSGFKLWIKVIWRAKWGNKTSAIVSGGYWIKTDYVSAKHIHRYFNHKHTYYNSSAGSGVVMECSKCGMIK